MDLWSFYLEIYAIQLLGDFPSFMIDQWFWLAKFQLYILSKSYPFYLCSDNICITFASVHHSSIYCSIFPVLQVMEHLLMLYSYSNVCSLFIYFLYRTTCSSISFVLFLWDVPLFYIFTHILFVVLLSGREVCIVVPMPLHVVQSRLCICYSVFSWPIRSNIICFCLFIMPF